MFNLISFSKLVLIRKTFKLKEKKSKPKKTKMKAQTLRF